MKVSGRFTAGITRYQPSDAGELAAFQRRSYGEGARQLDPALFAWRYETNPAHGSGDAGIWICRRNGEIVGQQAEIPVELVVDGKVEPAGWSVDLMVDPVWRMRGVGPGLVATHLEARPLVVGVTQPAEAFKSYMRSGWLDLGIVPVYVRPLSGRLLKAAPVSDRVRRIAPLAGPAIGLADAVIGAGLRAGGFRLEPVERFDERVDEVWAAAAPDYRVITRRDAATTGWRVDDHPFNTNLRRFYLVRKQETLGYVAFDMRERWGERVASVVDYLAPRRWVVPLLTAAAQEGRRAGATALVCTTKVDPLDKALRRAGFICRGVEVSAPLRLVAYCDGPEELRERIADPSGWFLTGADSDMT